MTAANSMLLDTLSWARCVANYADSVGFDVRNHRYGRASFSHLGAALADCVLQAGLNYRTVVMPRVQRIIVLFPETATLSGTKKFVENGNVSDFLQWKHAEKVQRFTQLCVFLDGYSIESVYDLRLWLSERSPDQCELLQIRGIGPKTVDYLSCLVGIDAIAVDRHIRGFARRAGIEIDDYDLLKNVFSYAADFLGASRRDFDAWVWNTVSQESRNNSQADLFVS